MILVTTSEGHDEIGRAGRHVWLCRNLILSRKGTIISGAIDKVTDARANRRGGRYWRGGARRRTKPPMSEPAHKSGKSLPCNRKNRNSALSRGEANKERAAEYPPERNKHKKSPTLHEKRKPFLLPLSVYSDYVAFIIALRCLLLQATFI